VLPPRKLYKIGEVMEFSGLSRQTIHNYTVMGLISEVERTRASDRGHRLYGEDVFARLKRIQELKKTKTLKEIRRILGGREAS
jgi:DNA-binding transcriptional MerR regulator